MDYSKSGNAKFGKGTPRYDAQNLKGAPKDKHGAQDKAALLARLKAAAEAKKQG